MKKSTRSFISLLVLLVFAAGLCGSASAENAADTILRTGTTQAFASDPVPDEDIRTILQAGLSAASAINQQPWFFAAVTNRDLMKEIGGSGMGFGGRPDSAPEGFSAPPEGGMPEGGMPEGFTPPEGGRPDGESMPAMPTMPAGGSGAKASLGDSPLAIIIYKDTASKSPSPDYDCGLATQNMVIAASSLGYGVKIVSSPTMSLNGEKHDEICEKLGVSTSLQAVAVLLIGKPAEPADAVSGASARDDLDAKTTIVH